MSCRNGSKFLLPALLFAVCAGDNGGAAAMSSPMLIDPAAMAGSWMVDVDNGALRCPIRFGDAPVHEGHALEAEETCLQRLGLTGASFWQTSTDGIRLADGEGRSIAFFSRQPDGSFSWRDPVRERMVRLRR